VQALGAENRTGFEARRRRQARSATPSRPSAERGGLDGVRRRLPETSAPMVICAAGLSPVRGLPHRKRPHYCLLTPSPSCAAGSLASARSPRTARIPQARRLLCSSTGQRCCLAHAGVSHGVLTRRAHTARSHGVRTTQRLAFAAAATSSLLLRPGLFPARSSRLPRVPRQEGRWATARVQLRGPRSTTPPRSRPGKLVSWTRSVRECIGSAASVQAVSREGGAERGGQRARRGRRTERVSISLPGQDRGDLGPRS